MAYPSKIVLCFLSFLLFSSCFKKATCPAYQSQFLVDKNVLKKKFSLFKTDSLPKEGIGFVKKNKNGIIVKKPYHKKFNEMKNIDMVTIYPDRKDTIMMASNVTDSLSADSLSMMRPSPYLTSFNYDQLVYNTLFGKLAEQKKEPPEKTRPNEKPGNAGTVQDEEKEKKSFFDFLKRKKKDKEKDEPPSSKPSQTQPPAGQPAPDDQNGGF